MMGYVLATLLLLGGRLSRADTPWHPAAGPLMTRWAKLVSPVNALPEYPRPQMARPEWQNLNGLWDYAVTDKSTTSAPAAYDGKILVPYCIESALSGVMKPFLPTQRLWYHRTFTVPEAWHGQHLLLHFGAVDWDTMVFVNGQSIGEHRGGYDGFEFDITRPLRPGTNEITVGVTDPSDTSWQLRGKQTLHPGGAAYTAVSGIWQTVWVEPVASSHIESLHMVPDASGTVLHVTVNARITPHPMSLTITALEGTRPAGVASGSIGAELTSDVQEQLVHWYKATNALVTTTLDVPIRNPHPWTPDDPFLYNLTVALQDTDGTATDAVQSYFGMRTLALGKDAHGNMRLLLNGRVTMLPMVLDQGFWPDGIYTAPTDDALRFDLEAEKRLGVNVRKHVKVESDRWYYWADKLGVLVLQDMPTGGEGDSYTDLPTSPEAAAQCETEMRALIAQRWNHPAIISWDMFNEGWGQHDTVATAAWAKQLDPSRLIDEASGFPWHGAGDIRDCHGGVPPKSATQISIDTENGSVGVSTPGHDWPLGRLWTPITYDPTTGGAAAHTVEGHLAPLDDGAQAWFTRRVRGQFRALWADRDATGQTGDSYCQITDVETEEDGLISYDRAVWKVDPIPIRAAARGEGLTPNVTYLLPTAAVKPTRWRYTTTRPVGNWSAAAYNDAEWKTGLSAFGQGYENIHTAWTNTPGDIWLRQEFTLTVKPIAPGIRMVHDEDAEVYLNGVFACRDGGYISAYDEFDIDPKAAVTLKPGKNVIAVHCRQTAGGQIIDAGIVEKK